MDRFATLQLFVRIVELGSFTEAAAALGLPRASATHAIKQLEQRLGARLLDRTTRQVRPTLDGQAYYERGKRVLLELDDAESALGDQAQRPRGLLRLDLHGVHATWLILPRLQEFRDRYPLLDLHISSGDRLVDLVKEGIDCVVRAGRPRDSSLVARPLAEMPQLICASPDYLRRHGELHHPDDLEQHFAVGFFARGNSSRYPITLQVDGQERDYQPKRWVSVSDAECYTAAALAGCGLIQAPRFRLEAHLAAGRLVEVLPNCASPVLPVHALYPFHRQLAPRVRVFIDWLQTLYAERFSNAVAP